MVFSLPSLALLLINVLAISNGINARGNDEGSTSKIPPEWYKLMVPGARYLIEPSPPNLPSELISAEEEANVAKTRGIYGGKGDKPHLGGFTSFDDQGYSENSFNYMLSQLGIRSMIDLGCGKGFSTKYFMDMGADVLCVEGSHDAVTQSLLPANRIIEHDFQRGPWWPERTYDAVWSVEFLEHVGRQYMHNYLPVLHKAALVFVTSSAWGGWHHVEVHSQSWWISRMAANGFYFLRDVTLDTRKFAQKVRNASHPTMGQHIHYKIMVFVNPKVASLPEHQHVIGGNGCYGGKLQNRDGGAPCTGIDALPGNYEALMDCKLNERDIWVCQKNPRAAPQPYAMV